MAGFPPALLLSLQVLTRQHPPWSGMTTLDLDAAGQVAQIQRSLVALARWEEPSPLAVGLQVGQVLYIHVGGFNCEVFAARPVFNLVAVPRITGAGCQWEPPELLQHKH